MSHLRIPALAVAALLALSAAVTVSAQSTQTLSRRCNAEASTRHLVGRSRRSFVRDCMNTRGRHLALSSSQRRMRNCNAQASAKGLSGMDRRHFVDDCLRLR